MIILAHIIPEILSAHIDAEMFITCSVYILVSYIASVFTGIPILALGLMLTFIQAVLTIFLGNLSGTPLTELISEDGSEFVMNIIYYITLSKIIVGSL